MLKGISQIDRSADTNTTSLPHWAPSSNIVASEILSGWCIWHCILNSSSEGSSSPDSALCLDLLSYIWGLHPPFPSAIGMHIAEESVFAGHWYWRRNPLFVQQALTRILAEQDTVLGKGKEAQSFGPLEPIFFVGLTTHEWVNMLYTQVMMGMGKKPKAG